MAAPDATDEHLVERARAGDETAFDELVDRHRERVYRLALRLTASPQDAEEVLQEAFLSVYRKLDQFRGEARFATWLYRIVANSAFKHHRAGKRHVAERLDESAPPSDAGPPLPGALPTAADVLIERAESARDVLAAIDRLPSGYRAALVLRDLEGLSTEETADVLEIEPGAVRVRLHRARLLLRGWLGHLWRAET